MNTLEWVLNIALVGIVAALVIAKWSVLKMTQQINRSVDPAERVSLKWWPNYKDRRVIKTYRSMFVRGRLYLLYLGSLGAAFIMFSFAIFLASHKGR